MNIKKLIGIIFLLIGIIGFLFSTFQKNEHPIFEERITSQEKTILKVDVEKDQPYDIKFWGVDEVMTKVYEQAHFEARVSIKNELGQVLFDRELVSTHETETGGKKVTHDSLEYLHIPDKDETISISIEIKKGDYLDVNIYKDMDSETDALPGFFIVLAMMGLVFFLRGRKKPLTNKAN